MKVTAKQYAKLILETTENLKKDQLNLELEKIAKVIKENRDARKLDLIIQEFERLCQEKEGLVHSQVTSARKLGKKELEKLKLSLAKKYQTEEKKVSLENIIDESIKGGLIVRVGNEIMDGSVKRKIEKLKTHLAN